MGGLDWEKAPGKKEEGTSEGEGEARRGMGAAETGREGIED